MQLVDAASYREKAVLLRRPTFAPSLSANWPLLLDGRMLAASHGNEDRRGTGFFSGMYAVRSHAAFAERRSVSFTFAPDGKTLVCHDQSGSSIRLWDTTSGRQRIAHPGYDRPAKVVVGSPNGQFIAADAGDELHVWDTASGQLKHAFKRTRSLMLRASFRPIANDFFQRARLGPRSARGCRLPPARRGVAFRFRSIAALHGLGISADGKHLAAVASWQPLSGRHRCSFGTR